MSGETDKSILAILDNVEEGIIITNPQGMLISANKEALSLLQISRKDYQNKPIPEHLLIEEPKGFFSDLSKYLATTAAAKEQVYESTVHIIRPDQSRFSAKAKFAPLNNKGVYAGTAVIFPDTQKEQEVERVKSEFLEVVSHQLRSPLGSMRWSIEMLLAGDEGKLPDNARERLKQVYESNRWMITLANDLLNVSRIDQGKIREEPELTNYLEIIKAVIAEEEVEAKKQGVTILLNLKSTQFTAIRIDQRCFREVIQNLLSNAVKYSSLNGKVTISCEQQDNLVKIDVTDNGIGIPEEDKKFIFSKFFRAANARKSRIDGTGLGLFVVKSYVSGWGGSITFESTQNKGTTFFLQIPAQRS